VAAVLREAGPFVAVAVLFEIGIVVADAIAIAVLCGPARAQVGLREWVRGASIANASAVLLPAGRAAGEAARATVLAPLIGATGAAVACAELQACALVANAAVSVVAAAVAWRSGAVPLALAVLGNGAVCSVLGGALLMVARSGWFGRFLRARFGAGALYTRARPARVLGAIAACASGRAIQTAQYGIVMHAVGGVANLRSALLAQGIHLVGASVGDAVPNQLGVTEGAYRVFARALDLESSPARALSIALVIRVAQLALALSGIGVATALAHRSSDA
jgi:uncharacterized membrane protein YbhN (UPF0104 family)